MPEERPAQSPPKRIRRATRTRKGGLRRRSKTDYENKAIQRTDYEDKGKAA